MSFEGLPQWSEDKDKIVAQISQNRQPFKILLKTKDDPEMLRDWIAHHQKIVGLQGLILMDNMSSDPRVAEIYDSLEGRALAFRFSGFQDTAHHTDHFPELYSALRSSCSHFAFLDTDEHLRLYDGEDHFLADPSILTFLERHPDTKIFPGTGLANIAGYRDMFSLWDSKTLLIDGLKWGKPIISTSCGFSGFINHNTQLSHSLYSESLTTNFFVLHLSRVTNKQRIDANLRKLKSSGSIPIDYGIDEVLQHDWSHLTGPSLMYLQEVLTFHEEGPEFRGGLFGSIQIADNGLLRCSEDWQKQALQDFLSAPSLYVSGLLSS